MEIPLFQYLYKAMKKLPTLIFLFLASLLHAQSQLNDPKWEIIDVTKIPKCMEGDRWIQMKSFNAQVHILYGNSKGLYYAYSADNGSTWTTETLDTRSRVNYVNEFSITPFDAALAIDSCGRPHVAYTVNWFYNGPSAAIHMMREKNGAWKRDTIESNGAGKVMIGFYIDLEIDNCGHMHTAYMYDDKSFAYGYHDGKKWNISRVDPGPRPIALKMTVDKACNPHIVIGKFEGPILYYYSSDHGESWEKEQTPNSANCYMDIAVNSAGSPFIVFPSYSSGSYNDPHCLEKRNGSSWNKTELEQITSTNLQHYNGGAHRPIIYIDPADRIHITYYRHFNDSIKGSLVYLESDNGGASFTEYDIKNANVYNYVESGYPGITITPGYRIIAFKGPDEKLFIARTPLKDPLFAVKEGNCKNKVKCDTCKKDSVIAIKKDTLKQTVKNDPPQTLKNRNVRSQGGVKVNSDSITIRVWDDGFVDDDVISLWLNEVNVLDNYHLTGGGKYIRVKLEPGRDYYLMLYAIDEGKMPPCTVAVSIIDANGEKKLKLSSDLDNCGALKIERE